ncbi:hypothetical protein [Octadecabacter antarcticus]|nr:hypothetical protein [Octadecabacter antarcticus]
MLGLIPELELKADQVMNNGSGGFDRRALPDTNEARRLLIKFVLF